MKYITTGQIKDYREQLLAKQKGRCDLCHQPIDRPNLDHAHLKYGPKGSSVAGNGMVRGVICGGCNTLLGKIENNIAINKIPWDCLPKWLHNAADYIQKHRDVPSGVVHPKERTKYGQRNPGIKLEKYEFEREA